MIMHKTTRDETGIKNDVLKIQLIIQFALSLIV